MHPRIVSTRADRYRNTRASPSSASGTAMRSRRSLASSASGPFPVFLHSRANSSQSDRAVAGDTRHTRKDLSSASIAAEPPPV